MYSLLAARYSMLFPADENRCRFLQEEAGPRGDTALSKKLPALRLLDAGCANGDLAFQLADAGLAVTGIDLDADMIKAAENRLSASAERYKPGAVAFYNRSMINLEGLGRFDAVTCFGNTLPHLPSAELVQEFFTQSAGILSPGGKLILQIINFDLLEGKDSFRFPDIETSESLFQRRYERRSDGRLDFTISLTDLNTGETRSDSTPLLPLSGKDMLSMLNKAGFSSCRLYSDYNRTAADGHEFATIYSASLE